MKATLKLEVIGGRLNNPKTGCRFIDNFFYMPPPCWCAEVTGFGVGYKFNLEFLRQRMDYSKSNSKGTRGVFQWYILEPGKIYKVKKAESWSSVRQFYLKVLESGETTEVEERDVEAYCETIVLKEMKEKRCQNENTSE